MDSANKPIITARMSASIKAELGEVDEPPMLVSVLTHRFIALIRSSGASYEEAHCALKAAGCFLQVMPLTYSVREDPPTQSP